VVKVEIPARGPLWALDGTSVEALVAVVVPALLEVVAEDIRVSVLK
jgi:hypothetical protein